MAKRERLRMVQAPAMLSPQQAADRLGVHVNTIYRAYDAGKLKGSKLGHSTLRIRPEWLDAWVEASASKAS